jgi:hypothetical protein
MGDDNNKNYNGKAGNDNEGDNDNDSEHNGDNNDADGDSMTNCMAEKELANLAFAAQQVSVFMV